jgi:hypothetical protein
MIRAFKRQVLKENSAIFCQWKLSCRENYFTVNFLFGENLTFCKIAIVFISYNAEVTVMTENSTYSVLSALQISRTYSFKSPCFSSRHCKENPIYVFLSLELHGLSPNIHIPVPVSDLYIPRIGPHIS